MLSSCFLIFNYFLFNPINLKPTVTENVLQGFQRVTKQFRTANVVTIPQFMEREQHMSPNLASFEVHHTIDS